MWRRKIKSVMKGVPDGARSAALNTEAGARAYINQPPTGSYCRPSATRSGLYRWQRKRLKSNLNRAVKQHKNIGDVHGIDALERGVSGRVLRVRYTGSNGSTTVRGATENRRILGGLPSGLWYIDESSADPADSHWVIRGGGYGHGVGLCQHGAMGMARRGIGYERILAHYYRGSRLVSLWMRP